MLSLISLLVVSTAQPPTTTQPPPRPPTVCDQFKAVVDSVAAHFSPLALQKVGEMTPARGPEGWKDCSIVLTPAAIYRCEHAGGGDATPRVQAFDAQLAACFPDAKFYRPEGPATAFGASQIVVIPDRARIELNWGEEGDKQRLTLHVSKP